MTRIKYLILALLLLFPADPASAFIGESRAEIENRYGRPDLLEDQQRKFKTFEQWRAENEPPVVWYGYLPDAAKERLSTLWLTYDRQNRVEKEMILFAKPIAVREFSHVFGAQYDVEGGEVFLEDTPQGTELVAVVRRADEAQLKMRFLVQKDGTRPNMHTLLRGFEVARIQPEMIREKLSGRNWQRADNFFRPGLYFSERLVRRARTDLIVIHHTAIEGMSIADIHQLHLSNGWAGIGYHKVVLPDGSIGDGRPTEAVGAHALGVNTHSVGIVVVGDFEKRRPNDLQLLSLLQVTRQMMEKYAVKQQNVVPHREATAGTSCPGAQFPWQEFYMRLKSLD